MLLKQMMLCLLLLELASSKSIQDAGLEVIGIDIPPPLIETVDRPSEPVLEDVTEQPEFTQKKRTVMNGTINWGYNVPYVIDSSFTAIGVYYTTLLKRAIQVIADNVCLTFIDETSSWDSSDTQWFTKNGYSSNDYIFVAYDASGCYVTNGGNLNGNRRVYVSPCKDIVINTHEWLHALGVAHMQQGYLRENYITINTDDIQESLLGTYSVYNASPNFQNYFFDPSSAVMYARSTWNRNGNEAYTPIRDDLFNTVSGNSGDQVNYLELNEVFKCAEKFCGGNTVDCAPGYYTYVKGVCRCVCPDEYDISTNCKTLKNGPSPIAKWPNTPIVVLAGGPSHSCPTGFDPTPGWFSFTGSSGASQNPAAPVQYPVSGNTNYFPVCTRNLPAGTTADWESWPAGGQYCFIKPAGVSCGGAFSETGGYALSASSISYNGSLGDVTIASNNLTIKACCRYQEFSDMIIDLPDGEPFRLLTRANCPIIRGLKAYNTRINFWTTTNNVFGPAPSPFWQFSNSWTTYSCYYQPGVYGCNELVNLDANNPSVTIRTPYLSNAAREPFRRCFYVFNAPKNSQILITFNRYSLPTVNDEFLVKRYHPWQLAYKIDNSLAPAQILSELNYFSAEAFFGYNIVTNYGVNFTAKVILPEDYCYDSSINGADYRGKTAISETYEPCIEWSKAVNCSNFPKGDQIANILSGSQCRNPDGRRGPWCYTYINGTNCNIRYCDACNFKKPIDALTKCATLKANNPNFCSVGVQRFGCFVACNYTVQPTTRAVCSPPIIPVDGQVVGSLKTQYLEGEKVQVKCILYNDTGLQNDMYCTATGWTTLNQACQVCPTDWIVYGDRCFRYFSDYKTSSAASANCTSYGNGGTLFRVKDQIDQQMVRDFKNFTGSSVADGNWISGRLQSASGPWYFTDSSIQMAYFNWSAGESTTSMSYDCIKMAAEYSSANNQGGWKTYDCEGTHTAPYMCEMSTYGTCADKVDTCESVMAKTPTFCFNANTVTSARSSCALSCGFCSNTVTCSTPTSTTYSRTSALATIKPGQVMTFACNAGQYYVSGDLSRACSLSGNLLGAEPVCQSTPIATDVNLNSVRRRLNTLPVKTVVILDKDGYRIPFNGNITTWYYFCQTSGTVYFTVYRKSGTTYSLVGYNTVSCSADFKWGADIAAASQIAVQKDDIIGAFTLVASTLSVNTCTDTLEKIMNLPIATNVAVATSLNTANFATKACYIMSLGCRVNPT